MNIKSRWRKILGILLLFFACILILMSILCPMLFKQDEYTATLIEYDYKPFSTIIKTEEYGETLVILDTESIVNENADNLKSGDKITFKIFANESSKLGQETVIIQGVKCGEKIIMNNQTEESIKVLPGQALIIAGILIVLATLCFFTQKFKINKNKQ